MFGAEVEHLLGLLDSPNERARKAAAKPDQAGDRRRGVGLFGDSDERHGAAMSKQSKVSIEVMWHR